MVYSNNEQILNYKHKIVTTLRRSEHHEQEQMKGNPSEVIEWLYQKQPNIRKIINSSMVNLFRMDLLVANYYVCRSYKEKTGRRSFLCPS